MIKIVIIPKRSKFERDMQKLGFSVQELLRHYNKEGVDAQKLLQGHERQKQTLQKLKEYFPQADWKFQEELSKEKLRVYEVILVPGGDNHFQAVSHFIENQLVVGINSDPELSIGALTPWCPTELDVLKKVLEKNAFIVDSWTRLKVELNGKEIDELALCEVFIGEEFRNEMSRQMLKFKDIYEQQKGSGFLVTTGAGSTGWYSSACRYLYPEGDVFPANKKYAKFILTEPYRGKFTPMQKTNGIINPGENVELCSLNDTRGVIVIDALRYHKFQEGSTVKVQLGAPLNILKK